MIGLPDCIRTTGTMAMYQFKLVSEASRTFVSKRDQPRIEPGDDGVDGAVRRRSPLPLFAKCENTPIDGCCRGSWLFEEQPFNQLHRFHGQPTAFAVLTGPPHEPCQTIGAILG